MHVLVNARTCTDERASINCRYPRHLVQWQWLQGVAAQWPEAKQARLHDGPDGPEDV